MILAQGCGCAKWGKVVPPRLAQQSLFWDDIVYMLSRAPLQHGDQ